MSTQQTNAKNETIKRELKYILKLQSTYDMKNRAHIEKILDFNEKNSTFQSAYGLKFVNRLNEIYRGDDKDLCIFCGKKHASNGVTCNDCTNKFTSALQSSPKTQTDSSKKEESKSQSTIITEENLKKVTQNLMGKAENAASIAREKLAREMENENVKKVTQTASREAKKASLKILAFWKSLSRKNKGIVIAIFALVLTGTIFLGKIHDNSSGTQMNGTEEQKILEATLQEYFPDKELEIKYTQKLTAPNVFEGEVGEVATGSPGTVFVSVYTASGINNGNYTGEQSVCWVTQDGKIIGYGNLFSSDTNTIYELR